MIRTMFSNVRTQIRAPHDIRSDRRAGFLWISLCVLAVVLLGNNSSHSANCKVQVLHRDIFPRLEAKKDRWVSGIESPNVVNHSSVVPSVIPKSRAISDTDDHSSLQEPTKSLRGPIHIFLIHVDSDVLNRICTRENCVACPGTPLDYFVTKTPPFINWVRAGGIHSVKLRIDPDAYGWRMSCVFEDEAQRYVRAVSVKYKWASHSHVGEYPGPFRQFQLPRAGLGLPIGSLGTLFSGIGSYVCCDGLLTRIPGIDTDQNQSSSANPKHSRIARVAPLLPGFIFVALGWRSLQFASRPRGAWYAVLFNGLVGGALISTGRHFIGLGMSFFDPITFHEYAPCAPRRSMTLYGSIMWVSFEMVFTAWRTVEESEPQCQDHFLPAIDCAGLGLSCCLAGGRRVHADHHAEQVRLDHGSLRWHQLVRDRAGSQFINAGLTHRSRRAGMP